MCEIDLNTTYVKNTFDNGVKDSLLETASIFASSGSDAKPIRIHRDSTLDKRVKEEYAIDSALDSPNVVSKQKTYSNVINFLIYCL